jgi:precorrin-4/cobalt-precorrin-4 C11-methyltransferase
MKKRGMVYFVGAGPGDPDLITLKGRRLLDEADVVIYAGSLVNPTLLRGIKASVYDSASMNLHEIVTVMEESVSQGKMVVRLHTGDTALFSALSEQIEGLKKLCIGCEVVPGVSSAMAGAATLKQELTVPEISQTVIFTRREGKTPVPDNERLPALATHGATMVIFLSAGMIKEVQEELLQGYDEETPFVVIEKASWPEERIVRGPLKHMAEIVAGAGITKTALIYVGPSLQASQLPLDKKSRLYDKDFTHEYRK